MQPQAVDLKPHLSGPMVARHVGSSGRAASMETQTAPLKGVPVASAKVQDNPELIGGKSCGNSTSAKCATPRAGSCLLSSRKSAPLDRAPNAKVVGPPPSSPRSRSVLSTRLAFSASIPAAQGGSFAVPAAAKDPRAPPSPRSHHSPTSSLPASVASMSASAPKDPLAPPSPRSQHSATSSLPASVASLSPPAPPKVAVERTLSTVSSGSAQEVCQSVLNQLRGFRALSPPRSDNLCDSECYRTEQQENCGNVSTTASSVCDSLQSSIDHLSSEMILAKVTEMIRMEITSCERRMVARLEAERTERICACDQNATDVEKLVNIVEALSARTDVHSISTLLEEERHLRDTACLSLHCKMEALTCLMKKTCAPARMNEDMNVDDMMLLYTPESADESHMDIRGMVGTRERINGSSDPMMPHPKSWTSCSQLDAQYLDDLLEQERRARESACATLREDMSKELHDMLEAFNETSLNVLLEHTRRERDFACATLRTDFCEELHRLRNDIQDIASEARSALRPHEDSCIGSQWRAFSFCAEEDKSLSYAHP